MSAVFESGAKSSEARPRYDLIPRPALEREAVRMAEGAEAHGENNYQRGKDDPAFIRDRINHLIEHALRYAEGDRSDDHLAAIRANAGMLIWMEEASLADGPIVSRQLATSPGDTIRVQKLKMSDGWRQSIANAIRLGRESQ